MKFRALKEASQFKLYRKPQQFYRVHRGAEVKYQLYTFADNYRLEVLGEMKHQATSQIIDLEQNFLENRKTAMDDFADSPSGHHRHKILYPLPGVNRFSIGLNYDKGNWYASLEGILQEKSEGISTATQGFQNQNQFNGEIGKLSMFKGLSSLSTIKIDSFSSPG